MTTDAPATSTQSRSGLSSPALTAASVLVLGVTLTWTFFSMRSVMNVGGSCADGGPYVSAQPCPDGSFLIAIAIPVMLITAMAGSAAALSINAPNLLIPMWGVLFGSLGWNFLEFAFSGSGSGSGIVWGWLVCGVMFWLMAAPAVLGMLVALKNAVVPPSTPRSDTGSRWWVPAYAALGAVGFLVGALTYNALS
jgi:hypothetical protein